MTSNLHYFKYHCNSLVYNTDIYYYPIKKKPLHHVCIKNILKDKNTEVGLTWYRLPTQPPITSYNSKINRYTVIIKSSANIFGG